MTSTWSNDRQGKCPTCKVRYVWRGRPKLRHARCPECRRDLERTSRALKWPVVERAPDEYVER